MTVEQTIKNLHKKYPELHFLLECERHTLRLSSIQNRMLGAYHRVDEVYVGKLEDQVAETAKKLENEL